MPFDPNSLAPLIGALNPNSSGFMRGWARGQQELAARKQQQQQEQQRQQQGLVQQEQLGFQRDANTRANQDQDLQRQQQQLQAVNSLRQLLGDESIDDPAVFDERMAFAQNMAPQMGVEPGFLQTLKPPPDTFAKRKLKKLLDQHEKRAMGEREQFEQAGVWRVGDQTYTPAQAREALGTGGTNVKTGQPFSFAKPEEPNEPKLETRGLDVQAADALRRGDTAEYQRLRKVADEMSASRQNPPINVTVGGTGLTGQQITAASGLRDDLRAESKDFSAARDGYERMLSAATDPSPAGDVALLYGFMKLLDPNSVVRETEFATAAKTGSLPTQIQAAAERVISGQRLTRGQRADFMNRAKGLFGRAQNRHDARRNSYRQIAKETGIPDRLVVQDEPPVDESVLAPPAASGGGSGKVRVGAVVRDKSGQRSRVKGFTPDGKAILEPVQ
jgi:hypothetical protein